MNNIRLETYCLHAITTYYDFPISIEKIGRHFYSYNQKNTVVELKSIAEKIGFEVHLLIAASWDELTKIPTPAILFKVDDKTHYAILEKANRWSLTIRNPKTNKKTKIFRFFNSYKLKLKNVIMLLPKEDF